MNKRWQIFLMVVLTLGVIGLTSVEINFANAQNGGSIRKIVVFEPGVPDNQKAHVVNQAQGTVLKNLRLINGLAIMVPEAAVDRIRGKAGVVRVDDDLNISALAKSGSSGTPEDKPGIWGKPNKPDKPNKPGGGGGKPAPAQPPQTLPWGIDRIDADLAWSLSQGADVKVAILDTGIDTSHPDLAVNVVGGINIINTKKNYKDDHGHGTHVAGIIGALNNEIGAIGVGPQINLYGVKVLDRNGSGWLSDIIAGLQWSIDNGMQVINMSLGSAGGNVSFAQAVQAVYQAGITQIAAAGNDGAYGTVNYPAKYSQVIAVSAVDSYNRLAYFSSYGPEIDIAAPGVNIYSTYKGGEYATMNGTSMAAPHVAGAVALKLVGGPLSPDEVRNILQTTAENLGLSSTAQGAGLVDVESLVLN